VPDQEDGREGERGIGWCGTKRGLSTWAIVARSFSFGGTLVAIRNGRPVVGLTTGCDVVATRGDVSGTSCAAFCFKEGRLVGVETVNRPADHMIARRLIGQHVALTPAQAADERFDLKVHLAREKACSIRSHT
jgi:hypothetical protein